MKMMKKVKTREALTKALLSQFRCETVAVIHSEVVGAKRSYLPRTVALVNVDKTWSTKKKLEKAFMLTNTIDAPWYRSDKVVYIGPEKSCRSTSVGDMVRLENGTKFKCEDTGWSKV